MKEYLKVKVVSLSAEMTFIRRLERKWKKRARDARQKIELLASLDEKVKSSTKEGYASSNFWGLRHHRMELKYYARVSHLAYGCMSGVPYAAMERICYGPIKGMGGYEPNWEDIMGTVERFAKSEPAKTEIMQRAEHWLAEAKSWYEGNPERIKVMNLERRAAHQTEEWKAKARLRAEADTIKYAAQRGK